MRLNSCSKSLPERLATIGVWLLPIGYRFNVHGVGVADVLFALCMVTSLIRCCGIGHLKSWILKRVWLGTAFMLFAITLSCFRNEAPITQVVAAGRLVWLFWGVFPCILRHSSLERAFRSMLITIGTVNSLLIVSARAGIGSLAFDTGSGRFGTVIAFPGDLAKIALLASIYLLSEYAAGGSMWLLFLLGLNAVSLISDGSRTYYLAYVLVLMLEIVTGFRRLISTTKGFSFSFARGGLLVFAFALLAVFSAVSVTSPTNPMQRILSLVASREATLDIRAELNRYALKTVSSNILIGTGLGTTMQESQVVHNVYLQMLSDLGILGFIGYLIILLAPLMPRRADNTVFLTNHQGHLMLSCLVFSGLFHPIGLLTTDWIPFFAGVCSLTSTGSEDSKRWNRQ